VKVAELSPEVTKTKFVRLLPVKTWMSCEVLLLLSEIVAVPLDVTEGA